MTLLVLDAPHFYCGVVCDARGVAVRVPPIVKYMLGWPRKRIEAYCQQKGWTCENARST